MLARRKAAAGDHLVAQHSNLLRKRGEVNTAGVFQVKLADFGLAQWSVERQRDAALATDSGSCVLELSFSFLLLQGAHGLQPVVFGA